MNPAILRDGRRESYKRKPEDLALQPLIAITTPMYSGENYRLPLVSLSSPYIRAVENPGGVAVLVTPAHKRESIGRLLDIVQGVMLSGGEDVDPARYGQLPHPELGSVSRARDEMEFAVLEGALARELPVLAVCRGIQVLNVAFGGTLFQDLPSLRPGELVHQQDAGINDRWHEANVETNSRLGKIFGTEELFINSFHHQGVDELGRGLVATTWAEDGLIEGVEATGHPWVLGVQWHPERGEAESAEGDQRQPDRRLFYAFIEAAREFASAGV